jgi:hypothetical protein
MTEAIIPAHAEARTVLGEPLPGHTRSQVTRLAGWELSRLVTAAEGRPCAAPGADPEDWFPEIQTGPQGRERYEFTARALCRFCPVQIACLEQAIQLEGSRLGHGIAGGTAPWQRQAIKASRGLAVRRG